MLITVWEQRWWGDSVTSHSLLFESFYKPNHMLFLQISVFSKNGNSSYLLSLHWHKCFFRGSVFLKEWLVPSKTPCVCLVNGGSRNWNTHVHWLWQTLWGSVFIFSLLWQEHWNLHVWVTAGIIGAQAEAPVAAVKTEWMPSTAVAVCWVWTAPCITF